MNITNAREAVLKTLRNANYDGLLGVSVTAIALLTGYAESTIRRTIGGLRSCGWPIVREGRLVRLVA